MAKIEDVKLLRKIAVSHVKKIYKGHILDPEDIVQNAALSLIRTKGDLSLLKRKSSFQMIDDLRQVTSFNRFSKKTRVRFVSLPSENSLMSFDREEELKEEDFLEFKNKFKLSEQEFSVLKNLTDSKPAEIAEKLGISICTVRTHIYNLRKKTSVLSKCRKST